MKNINLHRKHKSKLRHKHVLKRVRTSNEHIRVRIVKTNCHIYALAINDQTNKVLFSSSSLQLKLANGNQTNATLVGDDLAKKLLTKTIQVISFDRGGCKYHGRVAAVANALRNHGIKV